MIMVLGAGGQLGQCLLDEVNKNEKYKGEDFLFLSHNDLDITNEDDVDTIIRSEAPDVLINCAAYTNVEKAETDEGKDAAYDINATGVEFLATACEKVGTKLIHISTDYVFGTENTGYYHQYTEKDKTYPLNEYGKSKAIGEELALEHGEPIIVRTSWLYSEYGKNFYKTVMNRVERGESMNIVDDQWGSPTYARNLARFLLEISMDGRYKEMEGIYHYSDNGYCTWYDFGKTIKEIYEISRGEVKKDIIHPIKTEEYPQKAKRPYFSVLKKDKLESMDIKFSNWIMALFDCMKRDGKILLKEGNHEN